MERPLNHTKNYTTNQLVLPLNLGIKIKKDSEVFTYLELTKGLALEKYFDGPKDKGRHRKNRVQILNAILFGFMVDVRSTRALEKACQNDIRFMYLIEGIEAPSHQLINEVMKEVGDKLTYLQKALMEEIMKYEKIETEKLYIDGTKIEADANKYSFKWKPSILKFRNKLYDKVTKSLPGVNALFNDANQKPIKVDETYTVKTLNKLVNRLIGLIDQEGVKLVYGKGKRKTVLQRYYDTFKAYLEKLEAYQKDLEIIGPNRNSYAKTDYDATFMHMKEDHMRNAQLKPGYNVQIGVSNEYIMVIDAYQNGSDYYTFEPILEKYNAMYEHYPFYPVADAGYGSYDNYSYCLEKGMGLYQKYGMWAKERDPKFKKEIYNKENFRIDKNGNNRCPNNKKFVKIREYKSNRIKSDHIMEEYECFHCIKCKQKNLCTKAKENRKIQFIKGYDEMKQTVIENLDSELGIELRVQRSIQVEGAFGVIKEDMRFRRFTRTGFQGIKLELDLITIGYNLKKFHNKRYRS
ncbi:MAG: transposase [Acholeplasmataceae bacterium]|nr:transposase [Acholeplasmataceae bacterium]